MPISSTRRASWPSMACATPTHAARISASAMLKALDWSVVEVFIANTSQLLLM